MEGSTAWKYLLGFGFLVPFNDLANERQVYVAGDASGCADRHGFLDDGPIVFRL
jgi:hypothetical protein